MPTGLAGRLWIGPKPEPDNAAAYAPYQLTQTVSLLEPAEAQALGLPDQPAFWAALGTGFYSFPIPDYGVPEQAPCAALITRLTADLRAGRHVMVHCRGGVGRSGLIACGILILLGQTPRKAIQKVTLLRGTSAPETDTQRLFLEKLTFSPQS